jgi:hypothetical protein
MVGVRKVVPVGVHMGGIERGVQLAMGVQAVLRIVVVPQAPVKAAPVLIPAEGHVREQKVRTVVAPQVPVRVVPVVVHVEGLVMGLCLRRGVPGVAGALAVAAANREVVPRDNAVVDASVIRLNPVGYKTGDGAGGARVVAHNVARHKQEIVTTRRRRVAAQIVQGIRRMSAVMTIMGRRQYRRLCHRMGQ